MDTRQKPTGTPKPHADYYLGWINKIAAAAAVEISEATLAVYLERLQILNASQIAEAGRRTIDEWTEASKMPPLSFILERTEARAENLPTVREIRSGHGDYAALAAEAGADPGFARRVIDEMHAKLGAGAFKMPETKGEAVVDYRTAAEARARARNRGRDPDPGADHPEERKAWHHRKWLEWYPQPSEAPNAPQRGSQGAKPGDWSRGREPGEDDE